MRVDGLGTASVKGMPVGLVKVESGTTALIIEKSLILRRWASRKKEVFLLAGHPGFRRRSQTGSGLGSWTKGLREFRRRIGVIEKELSVILIRAGLGEDFDSAVTQLVILRGKRILVDANLTNGRLGRKLPAGESVDVDLAAIGAGRGSGEGVSSDCNSSGSSESASRSLPLITIALEFSSGFTARRRSALPL